MSKKTALLYLRANGLAVITLNRPSVLNAVDINLAQDLGELLNQIDASQSTRAIMIKGAGRAFCAGGDIRKFDGCRPHHEVANETITAFHPIIYRLATIRIPTVSIVHGAVAGAGLALMLACDFTIAEHDTKFDLAYTKIGASVDGGISWFLTQMLGIRKAKELAMLSAPYSATNALALGLVTRVASAEDFQRVSEAFASKLAAAPSMAYSNIKYLIANASSQSLEEQLDLEQEMFIQVAKSQDFNIGLRAFLGKHRPRYQGK